MSVFWHWRVPPAHRLVQNLLEAVGLPDTAEHRQRADDELGRELFFVGQTYVSLIFDRDELDRFFEAYEQRPRDGSSWTEAVRNVLDRRVPSEDKEALFTEAFAAAQQTLAELAEK